MTSDRYRDEHAPQPPPVFNRVNLDSDAAYVRILREALEECVKVLQDPDATPLAIAIALNTAGSVLKRTK
jgi:hypothetical protein